MPIYRAANVTNQPNSNINYILSRTVMYDISPKTNIVPNSTVKRKKNKTKPPALATLEIKTLFSTEFHVEFGSLFQSMNCFSDEKPGVAEVCVFGENPGWKSTREEWGSFLCQTNKWGGSYIPRMLRWSTESWGSSGRVSVRLERATGGVSSRKSGPGRVSVQLDSGSFLMLEL